MLWGKPLLPFVPVMKTLPSVRLLIEGSWVFGAALFTAASGLFLTDSGKTFLRGIIMSVLNCEKQTLRRKHLHAEMFREKLIQGGEVYVKGIHVSGVMTTPDLKEAFLAGCCLVNTPALPEGDDFVLGAVYD